VLDGDTSQWNRSAASSRAIGLADASPAAIRPTRRVRAHRRKVEVGGDRGDARPSSSSRPEVALPRQSDHPDVELLAAPTSGTTHHRVLEDVTRRRARSASSRNGRGDASRRQVIDVEPALGIGVTRDRVGRGHVRMSATIAPMTSASAPPPAARPPDQRARDRQQDMVGEPPERRRACASARATWWM
jgi:hypothetical protein